MTFSVPVTVTVSKTISAPGQAPGLRLDVAVRRGGPRRRASRRPPGAGRSAAPRSRSRPGATRARDPARASSGPSTSTEARIVLTRSYGASAEPIVRHLDARRRPASGSICAPMCCEQPPHRADVARRREGSSGARARPSAAPPPGTGAPRSWRPRSRPRPKGARGPRLRTCPRLADSTDPLGGRLQARDADARNALEVGLDPHEPPDGPGQDLERDGLGLAEADLEDEHAAGREDIAAAVASSCRIAVIPSSPAKRARRGSWSRTVGGRFGDSPEREVRRVREDRGRSGAPRGPTSQSEASSVEARPGPRGGRRSARASARASSEMSSATAGPRAARGGR